VLVSWPPRHSSDDKLPPPFLLVAARAGRPYVCACLHDVRPQQGFTSPPSWGLLRPLPVPQRPWSHIAVDFVTGFPPSDGNTVMDRFSKAAHFIPLPKLPSARETADLLVQHVVRLHGIPADRVSDHGPQFSSQLWKAFCHTLGQSLFGIPLPN